MHANFDIADDHEKMVFLWYKERNQRNFAVKSSFRLFEGMATQGLLVRTYLRPIPTKQLYFIPDVGWSRLDKITQDWMPKARTGNAHWEAGDRI